jgi:hypothetical protein
MPGIKSIKNTRNIDTYNRIDTPLQGSSGSTATVFIRWPYFLHTFDRVLRSDTTEGSGLCEAISDHYQRSGGYDYVAPIITSQQNSSICTGDPLVPSLEVES